MIITAHGRTAHCTDDTGASALRALAPLVEELESVTDRAQRTICSVGILRSGTARQVVPDQAELHVDLRAPGDAAGQALVAEIRRRAEARAVDGVRIEISGGITRPALSRSVTDPVYALAEELAAAGGSELRPVAEMGGSDASLVGNSRHWCWTGSGPPRSTSAAVPRRWCGTPSSHARRCWRHSSATRVGSPRTCRTERTIDDTRGAHTSSWCCKYDDSRWH
ncbi:peptidase dimerization domain-containing protein [Rhodococcus hoagii]|nr:peptidase dimerization domain-containing protein [Prescottella equi]